MLSQTQATYRYFLDASDAIVGVDAWWLAFAKENNAGGLDEDAVLGREIWDFICDEPTQTLYKEIHEHVRCTGNPITVPFRCDSPTLQRHMQLTIRKHTGQQLLYESTLVRALPQRRMAVLDPAQQRSIAFLTMCSFCKRSLVEPTGWLEMADISLKLRLFDRQTVPGVRYTVCPECESQLGHRLHPQQVNSV